MNYLDKIKSKSDNDHKLNKLIENQINNTTIINGFQSKLNIKSIINNNDDQMQVEDSNESEQWSIKHLLQQMRRMEKHRIHLVVAAGLQGQKV